ncbi:hypothetical protein SAMN05444851_0503 [Aliiroseovarius sediminilitoris]|uniref:HupE / UreJ protein n=1 Tax=Aliiroseovarius sediminilitoris TaxID=1173584 RepID=A0A1I0N2J0_9RHOB|nr:DUF6732 family protein [Aliiroseovarius sediminilitoris]SEV95031.1 hypothetical protein SAMN05444851_0503 [Aliiroseovarius sediminilitoris]
MTRLILLAPGLLAGPAFADPGHIGEIAGHGHVGGVILIGLAAAIGLWAALKGSKGARAQAETASKEASEEPGEDDLQEA